MVNYLWVGLPGRTCELPRKVVREWEMPLKTMDLQPMTSQQGIDDRAPIKLDAKIRRLLSRPTITAAELAKARILGLGERAVYAAINRGEIEVLRVGKHKKLVLTAPLRRQLGID
jgi:hypothetical protein